MKITFLQLNRYRGFESYVLKYLARVNLLVGKNNSGKTSVFEAVNLLTANGSPRVLSEFASRHRQRYSWLAERSYRNVEDLHIAPVFFGYHKSPASSWPWNPIKAVCRWRSCRSPKLRTIHRVMRTSKVSQETRVKRPRPA